MSNDLNIKWIKPSEYSLWEERGKHRPLMNESDITWIGTVDYHLRERKVVVRAIYRLNSLLITVRERLKDEVYTAGKMQYIFDGCPYITITSSGTIRFRQEPISSFFKATEVALVKYITEFMTIADLEEIKKKTLGTVDDNSPFWVL